MTDIKTNLIHIKELIADYEKKYGREKNSVELLAVSKGQSLEKMQAAFALGQKRFGESYLQEALPKIAVMSDACIEWHFIGPVQSNKTRKIAKHFAWVHSIANIKTAKRLNEQRPAYLPPLNICIEINIDHEATKSGIELDEILPLVKYCLTLPRLKLRGLMTIPAANETVEEQRVAFHTLRSVWQSLREQGIALDTLSMGMSEDFEAAIAEGSTIVRIGTSIFGPRQNV
jgi:pyridoxal phosphate enzyme (YggS family)